MKTKKAIAKRFRIIGSGELKRSKAFKQHILTKKIVKKREILRRVTYIPVIERPPKRKKNFR